MPHCNIPSKAQGRCLSKCSGPNRTSGQNDREARLAILRSTCRRFATLEQTAICQKTKLSHCKGSPHQASSLFAQILLQPPQYKRKTSRTVLPIISPGCCTISVGQTPYPFGNGARRETMAGTEHVRNPPKSPLTPLPRGFCGEALPHEDLSATPRSNPLKEDTLLTGYGWGILSHTETRQS